MVKAAIKHLYFETIHPFEDGNGRIGRVIAEIALVQGIKRSIRMSFSTAIEKDKKSYYNTLKNVQRTNNITEWIEYFIAVIFKEQQHFIETIYFSLKKMKFFDRSQSQLNDA